MRTTLNLGAVVLLLMSTPLELAELELFTPPIACESVAGSEDPVASPPYEVLLMRLRTVEPLPVSASVITLCFTIFVMPCAETVVAVVVNSSCYCC